MHNSKLKTNTILLIVLIILVLGIGLMLINKNPNKKETQDSYQKTQTTEDGQVFQIEGNKEDLISFSLKPGQEVSGKTTIDGIIKGGYFFEANILVSILDEDKKSTSYGPGHANATTDWMTAGPVSFAFDVDFSLIPKGEYFIKIMQDDPSGGESGRPIKFVIIPIVVK